VSVKQQSGKNAVFQERKKKGKTVSVCKVHFWFRFRVIICVIMLVHARDNLCYYARARARVCAVPCDNLCYYARARVCVCVCVCVYAPDFDVFGRKSELDGAACKLHKLPECEAMSAAAQCVFV
jgi:hypothetical protein